MEKRCGFVESDGGTSAKPNRLGVKEGRFAICTAVETLGAGCEETRLFGSREAQLSNSVGFLHGVIQLFYPIFLA